MQTFQPIGEFVNPQHTHECVSLVRCWNAIPEQVCTCIIQPKTPASFENRGDRASCDPKGTRILFTLPGSRRAEQHTSRQASWLPALRTGYSCGTALDLHQLPPLRPGIRALRVTATVVALDRCTCTDSATMSGEIDTVLCSRVACGAIIAQPDCQAVQRTNAIRLQMGARA